MIAYTLYVPVNDNDGDPIPDVHAHVAQYLALRFGGYTLTEATGAYRMDDGTLVREPVNLYRVLVTENPENDATLRFLASFVATVARQESVLLEVTATDARFVRGTS